MTLMLTEVIERPTASGILHESQSMSLLKSLYQSLCLRRRKCQSPRSSIGRTLYIFEFSFVQELSIRSSSHPSVNDNSSLKPITALHYQVLCVKICNLCPHTRREFVFVIPMPGELRAFVTVISLYLPSISIL